MIWYTKLKLKKKYYNLIKSGEKIYEVRLLDDKRKLIKIGDIVKINKEPLMEEFLNATVVDLVHFKTFEEMANTIPAKEIGFEGRSFYEILNEYRKFYSKEKEEMYGIVAIKVKL